MAGYFDLCGRIQHIFDEDTIPRSRVVDKDMGDSADKLAILYNRTPGHA